jgi:hypothetical protein
VDFSITPPGQDSYNGQYAEQYELPLDWYIRKYEQKETDRRSGKTEP